MSNKSNRINQAEDSGTGLLKPRDKQLSPTADDGLDESTADTITDFLLTDHDVRPGRGGAPVFNSYIQRMQRTHGNLYVQRMIESVEQDEQMQRKAGEAGHLEVSQPGD